MKKFVFRYQKILEMRIALENEVKNKLGKINTLIHERESFLLEVERKNKDYLNFVESTMKNGVRAADLQNIEQSKHYYVNQMATLQFELRNLRIKRTEIQEELIEANKQRKVLEKLKEKEIEQYKELESIEEAKVIDQIVTYNSTRKRGE